jgi:hypothetical protein
VATYEITFSASVQILTTMPATFYGQLSLFSGGFAPKNFFKDPSDATAWNPDGTPSVLGTDS